MGGGGSWGGRTCLRRRPSSSRSGGGPRRRRGIRRRCPGARRRRRGWGRRQQWKGRRRACAAAPGASRSATMATSASLSTGCAARRTRAATAASRPGVAPRFTGRSADVIVSCGWMDGSIHVYADLVRSMTHADPLDSTLTPHDHTLHIYISPQRSRTPTPASRGASASRSGTRGTAPRRTGPSPRPWRAPAGLLRPSRSKRSRSSTGRRCAGG